MSSSSLRTSRSATIRADKQAASVDRKKKAEARKKELEAQPATTETESSSSSSEEESDGYKHDDSDDIDAETSGANDDEQSESELTDDEDLDGDEEVIDFSKKSKPATKKRKREPQETPSGSQKNGTSSAVVKAKGKAKDEEYDGDAAAESGLTADEEEDLEDGRKVVRTKLVKAPSGMAPPGQIDKHTMRFLHDLVKNNDREWFAKNDARYRHALMNWQQFVEAVTPEIQRGDWSIPELPAKELIHRIYRDVRFSNDKTPYKKNLAASFSRTGRKGPFAGYYLQISPNGGSLLAGGKWGPERNELATIRTNLLRSSKAFRKVINEPNFVELFGPAKPDGRGKGKRCNVFGGDDMLKVAPKINGVDKTHKDIDLLKLRTMAVVYYFKDEEIVEPNFKERIGDVITAMSPLVLLINDMLHPQSEDENAENGEDSTDEEAGSEGGIEVA